MKARLGHFWEEIRSSLWFVPTVMTMAVILLAFGAVALDGHIRETRLDGAAWIYSGSATGARAVLSVIAGSVMTVAGVAFSITIAVLSLASSQYGPRLLRNFMRDKGNQFSLGIFISTFVYCLMVMRTIRSTDEGVFVPGIAVTGGVVLALISLGQFIYFINHTSLSIQPTHILMEVHADLIQAIDRLFPEKMGQTSETAPLRETPAPESCLPTCFKAEARPLVSEESGYVQAIDTDALMAAATEADAVVWLSARPGDFVVSGETLLRAYPPERLKPPQIQQMRGAFLLERHRTSTQDMTYAVRQMVEIAVRALSPGINDPFTAIACIDWLSDALCRLAERALPSPCRYDDTNALRIVAAPSGLVDALDTALPPLRQNAKHSPIVVLRLLDAMTMLFAKVEGAENREALKRHTRDLLQEVQNLSEPTADLETIEAKASAILSRGREEQKGA
jgi:uncharacterized membrane protein